MNPRDTVDQDRSVKEQYVAALGVPPEAVAGIVEADEAEFTVEWMERARGRVREWRKSEVCPCVTRMQWMIAEGLGCVAAAVIAVAFFYVCNRLMGADMRVFAVMAGMAAIALTLAYQIASWTKARVTGHFLHHRR
ncbi:hypothetical protein KBB96_09205 [Luteolibacter ambystomatis]|uniref:Uncharacterized protein n=1 Tax=Luteolibacter ambystomatis TaxID=2824561 RepID=A0A975J2W8_9BACT|nr:hypothetical protein [Luteolibacter ambystomatis]QUE53055.1 hypothetical protein KBB96_09205 [Luteolibacter ambystomatis]